MGRSVTEDIARGEFELLKDMVKQDHTRMENIDIHGTRGVGILQQQVSDVKVDVTEVSADIRTLRVDMDRRFDDHVRQHEAAEKSRVAGRRWLINTSIAFAVFLIAMASAIVDILVRLH
jgi:hypothetical protein